MPRRGTLLKLPQLVLLARRNETLFQGLRAVALAAQGYTSYPSFPAVHMSHLLQVAPDGAATQLRAVVFDACVLRPGPPEVLRRPRLPFVTRAQSTRYFVMDGRRLTARTLMRRRSRFHRTPPRPGRLLGAGRAPGLRACHPGDRPAGRGPQPPGPGEQPPPDRLGGRSSPSTSGAGPSRASSARESRSSGSTCSTSGASRESG